MKYKTIKKYISIVSICTLLAISATGCASDNSKINSAETSDSTESNDGLTNLAAETDEPQMTDGTTVSEKYNLENATSIAIDQESDNTITISDAGTYILSGSATEKQILVKATKDDDIVLVLDGIDISNSSNSPIAITKAGSVTLVLNDGSDNYVTDSRSSVDTSDEDTSDSTSEDSSSTKTYNSAIYCKSDLTIDGNGSLTVKGGYNDGIASKGELTLLSGVISIDSYDDGIIGKDSVQVNGGSATITCGDDCIKSTNTDSDKGVITIEAGFLNLTSSEGHGLTAVNSITVNDGDIHVINSFEGMESTNITINGGSIDIFASDDGINISSSTSDADSKSFWDGDQTDMPTPPSDEDMPTPPSDGDMPTPPSDGDMPTPPSDSETPDFSNFSGKGGGFMMDGDGIDGTLTINGGNITIDAGGDGLDSNGDIIITGGYTVVSGSIDGGNAALDYATGCTQTGGVLILSGNSAMATYLSDESTVTMLNGSISSNLEADTEISLMDSDGNIIYTWTNAKKCNYLQVAGPEILDDGTYTFSFNGESIDATTDQSGSGFGGFGGFGGGKGPGNFDRTKPSDDSKKTKNSDDTTN